MPKGLKRYYGHGHLHFLTFSCFRRLPSSPSLEYYLFVAESVDGVKATRLDDAIGAGVPCGMGVLNQINPVSAVRKEARKRILVTSSKDAKRTSFVSPW
jgi:hypothetical protein